MAAFRYTPLAGASPRSLTLSVTRYVAQAVLVANVEEARYDVLLAGEGKTLVRARYAVRNNQRSFLAAALPANATLWSASVAGRPLRPGRSADGAILLPLEKERSGRETSTFVVELVYLERGNPWLEKGRADLLLPALDLPVSRTGLALHYSPVFRLTPEPGSFRVQADPGPFAEALRAPMPAAPPPPPPAGTLNEPDESRRAELAFQSLVDRFRRDAPGRTVAGTLPVQVAFPSFGETIFLATELTAEGRPPSIAFQYRRVHRN
jgi:hypothetical protein